MPLILAVRNSPGTPGQAAAPLRIERGEVTVGRGAGAGLLLSSPTVSRRHCTISGQGLDWRVTDTSSGGTFVNGQRLSAPHSLRHGDVIRAGDVEIAVMLDAGAQPSAAVPNQAPQQHGRPAWGGAPATSTQVPSGWGGAVPGSPPGAQGAAEVLLQAAGLSRAHVGGTDQQVLAAAGAALRAALVGLTGLARDRRQAREELGVGAAEAADLASAGSAEELLLRLLALPPTDAAAQVGALCAELDAHQRAVLGAMQESFHGALDQFSPKAIKTSARGDAEAWKAYERAFDAKDGFVEMFAQALARHYAEAVRG